MLQVQKNRDNSPQQRIASFDHMHACVNILKPVDI